MKEDLLFNKQLSDFPDGRNMWIHFLYSHDKKKYYFMLIDSSSKNPNKKSDYFEIDSNEIKGKSLGELGRLLNEWHSDKVTPLSKEIDIELKKYIKDGVSNQCLNDLSVLNDLFVLYNNDIYIKNKDNKDIKDSKDIKTPLQTYTDLQELFKKRGKKEHICWFLYNNTESASEIDKKLDLTVNASQKVIERNDQFFEIDHKDGNKKFWKLSEKGRKFVENTVKEHLEKNRPSPTEEKEKDTLQTLELVSEFFSELSDEKLGEFSDLVVGDYVSIDFGDVLGFSKDLADSLLDNPYEVMKCFDLVIRDKLDSYKDVMFFNLPNVVEKSIGDIRTKDKGRFIVVEGNIVLKSKTEPRELESKFECPTCGNIINIVQVDKKMKEPSGCSCGRRGSFRKVSSVDTDEQKLVVEEPYDQVNRDVENINVVLQSYLTSPFFESFKNIGERVRLHGYIDTEPVYFKSGLSTHKTKFLKCLGMERSVCDCSDIVVSDEDVARIKKFVVEHDNVARALGELAFANIQGHGEIKEAIMLQQFGGVRKVLPDKVVRGDIHILLIGDPGTAKSDLLGGVKRFAPKVRCISGAGVSRVGLIGTVRFNDFLNSWAIEGGALAKANGGVVLADEFDKMGDEDRAGLHEALEQQVCTIDKANVHATLVTRTSLLASANPVHSGWDVSGDLLEQFNLPRSLLGRFDLMFPIKDIPDGGRDRLIAEMMLSPKTGVVDFDFIRKFIVFARGLVPVMSDEVRSRIVEFYSSLRLLPVVGKGRRFISARDINAIIRLCEAFAKSRLSCEICVGDVERAVVLHKFCLSELKYLNGDGSGGVKDSGLMW